MHGYPPFFHPPLMQFMIGNVRTFNSTEEKENPAGYNGPEFEDLDEVGI
jgi:hypothetical protein